MNPTNTSVLRPSLRKNALLVLGCALGLALLPVQTLKAADLATMQPLADAKAAAPALPLTSSFAKVAGGEKGPFVLTLKNGSKAAVTVNTKILLAVVFHAESKARILPAHTIEAGKDWKIADLALDDKVILAAEGFAPLEIVVK